MDFLAALDADRAERIATIAGAGRLSLTAEVAADAKALLQVALTNEVNVAELAALWVATTPELDVKLAFARQSGDEANHFNLVADRLRALGFDVDGYAPPAANALFEYLRGLGSTVARLAAGLFALEALAYAVNENFMAFCAATRAKAAEKLGAACFPGC